MIQNKPQAALPKRTTLAEQTVQANSCPDQQALTWKQILWTALIFLIALLVRGHYVISMEGFNPFIADAAKYVTIAENLHVYGIYSSERATHIPPPPESFITPGYPALLYAVMFFAKDPEAFFYSVAAIQCLLGALTAVLILAICRFIVPFRWAVIPAIITALSPHQIVSTGYLLTENLHTFLAVSGLYLLLGAIKKGKTNSWILSGVIFTASALTRPAFAPVGFMLAAILWIHPSSRLNFRALTPFLLALILTSVPWQIYSLTTPSSEKSNARNVVLFGSYPDMIWKNESLKGFPNRDDPLFAEITEDWESVLGTILSRAKENPNDYLQWYLIGKPASFWSWSIVQGQGGPFIYPIQRTIFSAHHQYAFLEKVFSVLHGPLIMIAAIYAFSIFIASFIRRPFFSGNLTTMLIASIPVTMTLIHIPLAGLPRYSIPYQPLAFALSIFAIKFALDNIRAKKENYN